MSIGIPYAYGSIDIEGRLVRTCPICGAECVEVTDEVGEQETNSYGTHYAREHDKQAA